MTFKDATDRLLAWGYSADEIGAEAGVSGNSILRARRSGGQVRPPPRDWRRVLHALALRRSNEAAELASELADA